MLPVEMWKDIPGYEGRYQASSKGRIRSVNSTQSITDSRGRSYKRAHSGAVLRQCAGSNGYLYVGLRKTSSSKNAAFVPVHHLIALAFLGNRPNYTQICHTDGNKKNNTADNLRYDTATENHIDVYRIGGKYGKLSVKDAVDVKNRLRSGESIRSIAERYDVTYQAIHSIAKGVRFQWVK